jgi:hypothetical protein
LSKQPTSLTAARLAVIPPSLPDADPRSGCFRRSVRESNFPAARVRTIERFGGRLVTSPNGYARRNRHRGGT